MGTKSFWRGNGRTQDENKIDTAIKQQHTATYGLFLSPILASFQNVPNILEVRGFLLVRD